MQYSALPRSSDWISAKLWGRSGDRHKPYYRETQSSRLSGAACRAAALEVRGVTASPICLGEEGLHLQLPTSLLPNSAAEAVALAQAQCSMGRR